MFVWFLFLFRILFEKMRNVMEFQKYNKCTLLFYIKCMLCVRLLKNEFDILISLFFFFKYSGNWRWVYIFIAVVSFSWNSNLSLFIFFCKNINLLYDKQTVYGEQYVFGKSYSSRINIITIKMFNRLIINKFPIKFYTPFYQSLFFTSMTDRLSMQLF